MPLSWNTLCGLIDFAAAAIVAGLGTVLVLLGVPPFSKNAPSAALA